MVYQKGFQKDFSFIVPNPPSCLDYGMLLYTADENFYLWAELS